MAEQGGRRFVVPAHPAIGRHFQGAKFQLCEQCPLLFQQAPVALQQRQQEQAGQQGDEDEKRKQG